MNEPAKRGRPPGPQSTQGILDAEFLAHLKLYKECREIAQERIRAGRETMTAEELGKFMDLVRRGIVDLAKARQPAADAEKRDEAVDVETILRTLEGGDGRTK